MIYVVVAHYTEENPEDSVYSFYPAVNELVTNDKADIRNIKELTYSYDYESLGKTTIETVEPDEIELQMWLSGNKKETIEFKTVDELKGWASK